MRPNLVPLTVGPVRGGQRAAVIALMMTSDLSLGGYRGLGLAQAYCDEALGFRGLLEVLVASREEVVVGFVVTLRGAWDFWRGFLLRHPLLALRLALHALSLPSGPKGFAPWALPALWQSQNPRLLRVLVIAVVATSRRQGVARGLYEDLVAREPASDLVALIMPGNEPSLALHLATGWTLRSENGCVLATRPSSLPR